MSDLRAGARPPGAQRFQLDSGLARLTPEERVARGKQARAEVPRDSHAVFDPPPDRPDPIEPAGGAGEVAGAGAGADPVGPDDGVPVHLLPRRGTAMASDLASTPVSGLAVQACGDAHLSNFGVFGSPERRMVFDVNDFDETLPGPLEWDVKRLAASLAVAGAATGSPPRTAARSSLPRSPATGRRCARSPG